MADGLEFPNEPTQEDLLKSILESNRMLTLAVLEIKDYLGGILEEMNSEKFEMTVDSHMRGFYVLPAPWTIKEDTEVSDE